jgi:predicted transposase YdaD
MGVNRGYKNSVFSYLFGRPDVLRELYGALAGVEIPPDLKVEINTLQDALFLDRINDLSFAIGDKLVVLIEHQSTINPNMAVRLLMYVARIYEKFLGEENIYSGKRIVLPRPECIVLYNGTAPYPDTQTIRLSDSFAEALFPGPAPSLELTARVYNINEGHSREIIRRSETLDGYSAFVAKAREYGAEAGGGGDRALTKDELRAAMTRAIQWCIAHNKIRAFLETNSSEVLNMLITEWDWDKFIAVREREAIEEGIEKGRMEGREEIARNALAAGLPLETVRKITGIDPKAIRGLANRQA